MNHFDNPLYLNFKSLFEKGNHLAVDKDFAKFKDVWLDILNEMPYFFNLVNINKKVANKNYHIIPPPSYQVIEVKDEQIKFIFKLLKHSQNDINLDANAICNQMIKIMNQIPYHEVVMNYVAIVLEVFPEKEDFILKTISAEKISPYIEKKQLEKSILNPLVNNASSKLKL